MSDAPELTEQDIATLVERFYARVRRHPTLGPVFNAAVHDWDAHLDTLVAFWSSVMLRSGRYRGNPMARHRPHPIQAAHFDDWLVLWRQTAHEVLPAGHAGAIDAHARRIARSLMYGLGLDPLRKPLGIPLLGQPDDADAANRAGPEAEPDA